MTIDHDRDYEAEEKAVQRINVARGLTDPKEREEVDRVARAESARASMTPNEVERYRAFETQFRVELARQYGDRLSATITDHLLRVLPLDHRAIQAMVGTNIEVPETPEEWRTFVAEVVEGDPLARLNLEHSDAEAKARLREEVLSKLTPAQRISMVRAGTLEAHLEEQVREAMHRRAGVSDDG